MGIAIGTQLGSHEITALLGKGGMGEVYRARDTKLKREVAIKILPDEFSRDGDRVHRFQREAEVLASLNHPNIAAIYNVEEANETRFLVLELVEGETLAERIQRGPIPVQEALDITMRICEALEAAHAKSVVHRDLKPANVKITPDGNVKVLDFGLAKAMSGANASPVGRSHQKMESVPSGSSLSNSPTLINSVAATNAGLIVGTAAYMSPEQARGFVADSRSDVFALGCVVYEMLTGRQAFQGETVSDILASVLAREPDFALLPKNLSPRLHDLFCLVCVGQRCDRVPLGIGLRCSPSCLVRSFRQRDCGVGWPGYRRPSQPGTVTRRKARRCAPHGRWEFRRVDNRHYERSPEPVYVR